MSEGAEPAIKVHAEGRVTRLRLNRPERGNALSAALVAELHAAIDAAGQDGTRLLVIDGAGRHFCTGFDLSGLEQESDDSLLARFTRVELMLQALHAAPFDTLAVVHGRVMGAGADIFCACANRWIVGPEARFAFPGSAFGLVLGTGRLARTVGSARARAWVQSGELFDAAAAVAGGLAQRQLTAEERPGAEAAWIAHALRLDEPTQAGIHAGLESGRRAGGAAADAEDLARLVRSAARAGLKERIQRYRAQSAAPTNSGTPG